MLPSGKADWAAASPAIAKIISKMKCVNLIASPSWHVQQSL
jgi:hypothetical protein